MRRLSMPRAQWAQTPTPDSAPSLALGHCRPKSRWGLCSSPHCQPQRHIFPTPFSGMPSLSGWGWVGGRGGAGPRWWLHLALEEAPDPVEVGVVVVSDNDLQPADADLGVHRVQQGGVALGQAHHHLCRPRAGQASRPLPSPPTPVAAGLTLGQWGPVQEPVQEERCLEGPPLGDVDGAGRRGRLVQGLRGPQLEEGLHGPGQAGSLRQVWLGQRGACGIQPALKLQPCREDTTLGSRAGLPGRHQTPRVCLGVTVPGLGAPRAGAVWGRPGSPLAPATPNHWGGFGEGAHRGSSW